MSDAEIAAFQEIVWEKGRELFRDMPWRQQPGPYQVLVSELMLQQTQVDRVIPKFIAFMNQFPSIDTLANAPLAEVLQAWSGLGYNRRARFLHEAAKQIQNEHKSQIPADNTALIALPGVGLNTAGAILAYAFSQPTVFIETNVRTVYFHHFFPDTVQVSDAELRTVVEQTLDREHPREWYWALMDYGAFLKRQGAGQLDKSRHYKKQAPLKGSLRETRGAIIKLLVDGPQPLERARLVIAMEDRFDQALASLVSDGLVISDEGGLRLP